MTPKLWSRSRSRGGFSLLEVIVALMVVLTLVAIVTPNLVARAAEARVERASATLRQLAAAIEGFEIDVEDYPGTLDQLVEEIDTGDRSSCGRTFPNGHVRKWEGPYLSRVVPPGGIPVGIGTARTGLVRAPEFPASGSSGSPWWMDDGEEGAGEDGTEDDDTPEERGARQDAAKDRWSGGRGTDGPGQSAPVLQIQVDGVLEEDARGLDRLDDSGDGAASGYVRWTAPDAGGWVTLYYAVPVRGC